jgi:hypothetical protein
VLGSGLRPARRGSLTCSARVSDKPCSARVSDPAETATEGLPRYWRPSSRVARSETGHSADFQRTAVTCSARVSDKPCSARVSDPAETATEGLPRYWRPSSRVARSETGHSADFQRTAVTCSARVSDPAETATEGLPRYWRPSSRVARSETGHSADFQRTAVTQSPVRSESGLLRARDQAPERAGTIRRLRPDSLPIARRGPVPATRGPGLDRAG